MSTSSELDQISSVLKDIAANRDGSSAKVYLLIDGARLLSLPNGYRQATALVNPVSLFGMAKGHEAFFAGPLLTELTWEDRETSGRSRQLAKLLEAHVCSVVVTSLTLSEITAHLAPHIDVTLSDDTMMLMRFFDPRVLPFWFDVLPSAQQGLAASRLDAWGYCDHRQQFTWLPLAQGHESGATQHPLHLSAEQEELLMRNCLPYALLDKLLIDPDSGLLNVPSDHRYEQLDALIDKAQLNGFDGMADIEEMCRLGLRYGLDVDECPPMKRALSQNQPRRHLHALLAQFTEPDWQTLSEWQQHSQEAHA